MEKIENKQYMEELILCIIKQDYADVIGYEDSFPIPNSNIEVYDIIEGIIKNENK